MTRTPEGIDEELAALRIDRDSPPGPRRAGSLKWVFIAVGLVMGIGVVVAAAWFGWGSAVSLGAPDVRVAVVARRGPGGAVPVLTASGYVIARNQVEVGSKITGRVVTLEVREGDSVRQGQVIARLDNYEVSAQVKQAEASLSASRARLAELESGSRPQEIDRANAEMERARADLRHAETDLRRYEALASSGVLEKQRLDDARARYEVATETHRAASQSYDLARIGPRVETIDLARAQVRQAEAELAYARAHFGNTIIQAPISGTVLDRYVDVGEMVTTGFTSERGAKQALFAIADLRDLQVELDVTEADIAKVKLGQQGVLVPDAYADRRYRGTVEFIASVADRQKATIKVKVNVLEPDGYLRPDMGAKVTFYEEGVDPAAGGGGLLVPAAAVRRDADRTFVCLIKDGKATLQTVVVAGERDGYAEVVSGLNGGETVAVAGHSSIKDGDRVRVQQ